MARQKQTRRNLFSVSPPWRSPPAAWAWRDFSGGTSTDNAYVRGDVTSLAPKVAGYVVAVDVDDNQAVRAGDVLFRIDDRDYRARLAQAAANVEAAEARLGQLPTPNAATACADPPGRGAAPSGRGRSSAWRPAPPTAVANSYAAAL